MSLAAGELCGGYDSGNLLLRLCCAVFTLFISYNYNLNNSFRKIKLFSTVKSLLLCHFNE